MKKEIKKYFNKTASMSYSQILIMVIATFAFAYLVAMTSSEINPVKADPAINCCAQTKNNQICQNLPSENCSSQCNSICQPNSCNSGNVPECNLGCCVDSEQGNCIPNTPATLCQQGNVAWKSDAFCNYPECKPGCCVLGDKTAFTNSKKCEVLTSLSGLSTALNYEFHPDMTEAQCIGMERSITTGACLFISDKTNCKITTKDECVRQTGSYSNFYENYLCTAKDLNSTCKPTNKTTCVDEKDKVYFLDSCNNVANIYDSSKIYNLNNNASVEYWTRIFSENESCSSSAGSINSKSCGNCEYLLGSRCNAYREGVDPSDAKPDYGNLYCRDLNCYAVPVAINTAGDVLLRADKKQGESWCIYENLIGNVTQELHIGDRWVYHGLFNRTLVPIMANTTSGTDPVGSRHYIAQCLDGNFSISPCDEYRNNICTQSEAIINNETNETFSFAGCRLNEWQECLQYNYNTDENVPGQTTNDKMNDCVQNPDCYIKQVDVADYFNFPYCMPKYKPAFDLTEKEGTGKPICALASQTCEVVYVKGISGWSCEANCNCISKEFSLKMNEFCRSMGDCGAQTNVAGNVTTKGFRVSGAPGITSADFKNLSFGRFTSPEIGKVADSGNLSYFFKKMGVPPEMADPENLFSSGFMGGIMGAGALLYVAAMWAGSVLGVGAGTILTGEIVTITYGVAGTASAGTITTLSGVGVGASSGTFAGQIVPFFQGAGAALAGAAIGYMLGKMFGLSESASIALAVIGLIAGIILYMVHGAAVFPPLIIIAIILYAIFAILGIGKKKSVYVTTTCLPWEQPVGGNDCDFCNQNNYLDCNRYKCQSLGAACKFINEGTSSAKCIASVNDHAPPILAPLKFNENYSYNVLTNGYEIKDKNGNCFEAWTDVNLGVTSTNEVSQCKIETKAPTSYDAMQNPFPDLIYDYNHSMMFKVPSADFLGAIGFDPSRTGQMKFYIRCQDDWGNKNPIDYMIKTCVKPEKDTTPTLINKFSPDLENAYLGFEKTNFSLTLYTNEPAECKYSLSDKTYDEMEKSFACGSSYNMLPINATIIVNGTAVNTSIEQTSDEILMAYLSRQTIFGFPCYSSININSGDNSTIFIRCKDQPWYSGVNETLRNANQQSQPVDGYKIKLSSSPLNISSILPRGNIVGGVSPFTIDLEATTSGGADGTATCYYSFDNSMFSLFTHTNSVSHKQSFNQMITGDYTIYVKCIDVAGNVALSDTTFSLDLDTSSPKVVRAYSSSGTLHVVTIEDSECAYSPKTCNFLYENGTKMDGYGTDHTTSIESGKSYYIKCKDLYNNLPGGCSIKVEKI